MNEFFDAVKARLRSPILGYLLLTSLALNWRAAFYLLVDSGSVLSRIAYFDAHTSIWSLLAIPGVLAVAIVVTSPWVAYFTALVSSKPVHLSELLHVRAEHRILIEKKRLEGARAGLLAATEEELIERAKRDQKVEALESDEVRERLRLELEQLRAEREAQRSSSDLAPQDISQEALSLLAAAAAGDGTVMNLIHLGGSTIQAGGKNFIEDGSRRAAAKWEAAVTELLNRELIEDKAGKGEVLFVTAKGYRLVDGLRKP